MSVLYYMLLYYMLLYVIILYHIISYHIFITYIYYIILSTLYVYNSSAALCCDRIYSYFGVSQKTDCF